MELGQLRDRREYTHEDTIRQKYILFTCGHAAERLLRCGTSGLKILGVGTVQIVQQSTTSNLLMSSSTPFSIRSSIPADCIVQNNRACILTF